MHNTQHGLRRLNQCRQTAQRLIQQTQQSDQQYRQMLHQERQNIQMSAADSKPRTTSRTYHSASAART